MSDEKLQPVDCTTMRRRLETMSEYGMFCKLPEIDPSSFNEDENEGFCFRRFQILEKYVI
jgi:hypothetical protein